MNDEKFEKMMENWASQEIESAPQLHPKKDMYQMLKAKKRKGLFPVFARWVPIGIAAGIALLVAILNPGIFRPSTYLEQTTKKEELSVGQQKAKEAPEEAKRASEPKKEVLFVGEREDTSKNGLPAADMVKEGLSERPQKQETPMKGALAPGRAKMDKPTISKAPAEQLTMQHRQELEEEAIPDEARDITTETQPPAPLPEIAPVSADEQTIKPVPTPTLFRAKSRTSSESRKIKILSTRAETPSTGVDKEFDADDTFYDNEQAPEPVIAGKDVAGEKQLGSKTFQVKDGIWVDSEHSPKKEIIKIKRDSPAYHDLITAMPDLKAYFEIGQNVIVNIEEFSIAIADDGKTELPEDELRKLVKE